MANNNTSGYSVISGYSQVVDNSVRSIGDPTYNYESLSLKWLKNRAMFNGDSAVKQFDRYIQIRPERNILIAPKGMTQETYDLFKPEAVLPGLAGTYLTTAVSAMMRKSPLLKLPEGLSDDQRQEFEDYLEHDLSGSDSSLSRFLEEALMEELITGRAWIYLNVAEVDGEIMPSPVLYNAESIVNFEEGPHPITGRKCLLKVATRQFVRKPYTGDDLHTDVVDTLVVHYLDAKGVYRMRTFITEENLEGHRVQNGKVMQDYSITKSLGGLLAHSSDWKETGSSTFMVKGETLDYIPFFPMNGDVEFCESIMQPLFDREANLYNLIARRNHLLWGSATFTPVVKSDMSDEDFENLVQSGLGSWLRVRQDEDITTLDTPTDQLKDMEAAIEGDIEQMTSLGLGLLNQSSVGQSHVSGTSLAIRNAPSTFKMAALNTAVSRTMQKILAKMMNWRYGTDFKAKDVKFKLEADIDPTPVNEQTTRLMYEMYTSGVVPRSAFVDFMKQAEMLPADYNDADALVEINEDELVISDAEEFDRNEKSKEQAMMAQGGDNIARAEENAEESNKTAEEDQE